MDPLFLKTTFSVKKVILLQAQSDKIKLQLRIEELQHKYEPKGIENNSKLFLKHVIYNQCS